ncbi:helix-hairpin-helix domain-containing protein [Exilibacterium tricleocarpae]|uniref:Helix-hairpin-helix domain-containing protein n=1 Tax=Exilibacterium tricleocarpae TaxID=2591008 RepID=A0A545U490_9GAMM|nr:ComEA family DNA-binding protein [Exilibacterium tricleocarpae]TQV84213.1 helix-hairpin-helix domain-containing protein [Exilibacterium tricleocarpae]
MKQVVSSLFFVFALLLSLASTAAVAESGAQQMPAQVNINSADAETLSLVLKGVGRSKAEAIVAWRESHGGFSSADQLAEVKGIGLKLVEKNRDRILLK